jgi:hypothetical protein
MSGIPDVRKFRLGTQVLGGKFFSRPEMGSNDVAIFGPGPWKKAGNPSGLAFN